MSPLSLFIIFITAVTFITARFTLNRLKEPVKSHDSNLLQQNNFIDYWKNAEITNGRLAMMGLLALVVNYGLFGLDYSRFFLVNTY